MDRFLLAQKDYLFADLWALYGLTQALIHPSAWKRNSGKSICRIVHRTYPLADKSPPEAACADLPNHNL